MKKLNKIAPKISIDDPMYSTKFFGEKVESEYDIWLFPIEDDFVKNIIPDDVTLSAHLYNLLFTNNDLGFNIESCLDYHFNKTSIDKIRFIDFTKRSLIEMHSRSNSSLLKEDILKSILAWCETKREVLKDADYVSSTNKNNLSSESKGLTHRQHALINKYKAEAKYIPTAINRTEIRKQYGKGREKANDSVNEFSAAYKKVTAKELEKIIPELAEFPNAQRAAINDLDKLS